MATHIADVVSSGLPLLTKEEFVAQIKDGDMLFLGGDYLISHLIEKRTGSPWSHVGMLFTEQNTKAVLCLEAVHEAGIRIGSLDHYMNHYKGTAILARIPTASYEQFKKALNVGILKLDGGYDTNQLLQIGAQAVLPFVKPTSSDDSAFCSGLMEIVWTAAGVQLNHNAHGNLSPEELWNQPLVVGICGTQL
jgi:hypothetical protein